MRMVWAALRPAITTIREARVRSARVADVHSRFSAIPEKDSRNAPVLDRMSPRRAPSRRPAISAERTSPMTVKSFDEPSALATELNATIAKENPNVLVMLSAFGKRIFFPKGILAQAAEAKEKASPVQRDHRHRQGGGQAHVPPVGDEAAPRPDARPTPCPTPRPPAGPSCARRGARALLAKNPSLKGKSFSMPIVTTGVTHALSLVGDLFVDPGDTILLPDKYWENYDLLFGVRFGAQMATFPLFAAGGGFDVEGLRTGPGRAQGSVEDHPRASTSPTTPPATPSGRTRPTRSSAVLLRGGRRRDATCSWSATTPTSACSTRSEVCPSRSSPAWPAGTSGSWPSRPTAPPRRSTSGDCAPAC